MLLIEDLDSEKYNSSNEIISLFSQYFFDYFNNFNKHFKVFWHAKCFSINSEKLKSYLRFRSKIIKNVMTTYFLKSKNAHIGNVSLDQRELECKKFSDYKNLEDIQDGILYFDGKKIDLSSFYDDTIKILDSKIDDTMFSDLLNFS